MKQFRSTCITALFALMSLALGGQTPDSTAKTNTVVTDRINDLTERDRGPSLAKIEERADKSFANQDYYAAMKYYGIVLNVEPLRVTSLKGFGESAFEITAMDSAAWAFQRMVDHGVSTAPDYYPKMRLAEVKFRLGDYDGAIILCDDLLSANQNPPVLPATLARARALRAFCEWALGVSNNPHVIKESFKLLDTNTINTRGYSEYMSHPGPDANQIYFSAYRFDFEKDKVNPKRKLIKLLTATDLDGRALVAESELNDPDLQHTAHVAFSGSGNAVYYAVGTYEGKKAVLRFDLYRRIKQPGGFWGPAEKLNAVNAEGFSTTKPSIGTLPGEQHETLFFVSDRPGGMGGRDIWHAHLIGDSITAPKALNSLNTTGNETTPYFHTPSGNLYFSTDGGVTGNKDSLKTIGGFDVYKSKYTVAGKWGTPKHMGMPINSPSNDVYFALTDDSRKGYLSSNQLGDFNLSEEGCCYDIYSIDFFPPTVTAIGLHKLTKQILPYTRITLYEVDRNGIFIPAANPQPDSTSTHKFEVLLGKKYVLVGEKQQYSSDTLFFETPDEIWEEEMVFKLYLKPFLNLIVTVYDEDTGEPLNGATTTFFDLGFRNESGKFIKGTGIGTEEVLPDDSNRNTYKIDFEHQYRVLAAKEGYVAPTSKADSSIVISTIGRVTGGDIEVKLYLHRPSALEEYLPLTLYFDNDYPKKDVPGNQDTILLDYQKTFVGYMRKKDEYLREYSRGLTGTERQAALDTLDFFFEKEVRMNWDSFFAFSDKIDLMLQQGDTIILTLKGYASPLSNPDYNKHLTNRRIASVFNHFMIFDGGIFTKYREIVGTGQIRFIREPNGDTEAVKAGVNGNPRDRRQSVYDVKASRSRRVQIIGARVSKSGRVHRGL